MHLFFATNPLSHFANAPHHPTGQLIPPPGRRGPNPNTCSTPSPPPLAYSPSPCPSPPSRLLVAKQRALLPRWGPRISGGHALAPSSWAETPEIWRLRFLRSHSRPHPAPWVQILPPQAAMARPPELGPRWRLHSHSKTRPAPLVNGIGTTWPNDLALLWCECGWHGGCSTSKYQLFSPPHLLRFTLPFPPSSSNYPLLPDLRIAGGAVVRELPCSRSSAAWTWAVVWFSPPEGLPSLPWHNTRSMASSAKARPSTLASYALQKIRCCVRQDGPRHQCQHLLPPPSLPTTSLQIEKSTNKVYLFTIAGPFGFITWYSVHLLLAFLWYSVHLLLAFVLISAYAVVVRMREEHSASIIFYEIQWIVLLVLCHGVILIWMRSSVRVLQANL
jgi:hypothetical protein